MGNEFALNHAALSFGLITETDFDRIADSVAMVHLHNANAIDQIVALILRHGPK